MARSSPAGAGDDLVLSMEVGRRHVRSRPSPIHGLGEMRERSNRAVSKTVEPLAAPWVRIPLSPRGCCGPCGGFGRLSPSVATPPSAHTGVPVRRLRRPVPWSSFVRTGVPVRRVRRPCTRQPRTIPWAAGARKRAGSPWCLRARLYLRVRRRASAIRGRGRDDRVAEGARLEGVCTRKGTVGSNPTLSVQPSRR